jgi:hypothetical protein
MMAEGSYFSRKGSCRRANAGNALLKPVEKTQLVRIDAVVGLFDIRIGQMLVAVADVHCTACTEAIAESEVFAKLKSRAEALVSQLGR